MESVAVILLIAPALAAVAIACFAFALWRSTNKLWKAVEAQRTQAQALQQEQRRDTLQSIFAAQRSSEAVEQVASTARETAERQLRAYVHVHQCRIANITEQSGPVVTIKIRNFGQTPARNLHHLSALALAPANRKAFDFAPAERKPLVDFAPSGEHDKILTHQQLTPGQLADLQSGKLALFAIGLIEYRDVFNNEHVTKYRFMVGGHVGLVAGPMAPCEEGNEAT